MYWGVFLFLMDGDKYISGLFLQEEEASPRSDICANESEGESSDGETSESKHSVKNHTGKI